LISADAAHPLRASLQSSEKSIATLSSFRHFQDMPRYYFNVHNVSPSAGDLGEELPDNEAAWQRATVIAGAALFKDDGMFRPGQEWALRGDRRGSKADLFY
jgi:hypothetical protein